LPLLKGLSLVIQLQTQASNGTFDEEDEEEEESEDDDGKTLVPISFVIVCTVVKEKVSFYVVQYPDLTTIQSAITFSIEHLNFCGNYYTDIICTHVYGQLLIHAAE